jgi:hypothetical protein
MEEEGRGVDGLLKLLPPDLSDLVSGDNDLFRQEIVNWDKEQLELEAKALESAKAQKQAETGADANNDVQVSS